MAEQTPRALSWVGDVLVRTVAPVLLALLGSGLIIAAIGVDPLTFYADVLRLGVTGTGWQKSLTAMAPLMIIALGLIVAFRAQLWNLGYNGGYLLAAAVVAGLAPTLLGTLPFLLAVLLLLAIGVGIGAALAAVPAVLKVTRGTNEIVTSLMMSWIAISLANMLIKGPFQDPDASVPQTRILDFGLMLPYIPGTSVHVGFLVACLLVVAFHWLLMRSSFGLRIDVLGASPAAATHAGLNVRRLILWVFLLSGGLVGFAAAIDMLGLWGYIRTNWNPASGDKILPFVFLARLNPLGSIPLIACYAVIATGGTLAAQRAGLSVDFLLIFVALILLFMTVIEAIGSRVNLGRRYLPARRSRIGEGSGAGRG